MSYIKPAVSLFVLSLALSACGDNSGNTSGSAATAPKPAPAKVEPATAKNEEVKAAVPKPEITTPAPAETPKLDASALVEGAKDSLQDVKKVAEDKLKEKAAEIVEKLPEPVKAVIALPEALAGGDLAVGKREFNKCKACHTTGEGQPNRVGPNLFGIFGNGAGQVAKFRYSKDMLASGFVWDLATLDEWTANPRAMLPKTSMSFVGIKDEAKRKALLAYLYTETGGE